MRLFIAVALPNELKKKIYEKVKDIKINGVKLVEEENYHITLLFVGEVSEEEYEVIKEGIKQIRFNNVKLKITHIGYFPDKKPRVVWLGVEPKEVLYELHEQVVKNVGIIPDKPFKPHITIARIKNFSLDSAEIIKKRVREIVGEEFYLEKVVIYESILRREGPIYKEKFVKKCEMY